MSTHCKMADPERFDGDGYYLKLVKTPKGYNVIPFDSDCDAQMHGFGIAVFVGDDAKDEAIKYAEKTTKHSR